MGLFKWLFGKKPDTTYMDNITIGERQVDGFAPILKDGVDTGKKILVFTEAQGRRLQEVADKIYEEEESKTKLS